jgi:WD40 repeat protein
VTQVSGPEVSLGLRDSPYRGLMPYTEADADLFFGREAEVRLIANTAKARRFVVLYGPSGVGKSSVLQAGVVRQIRDENKRRFERFGAVETVVAYVKEWRDDPDAALLAAVRDAFATMPGAGPLTEDSQQPVGQDSGQDTGQDTGQNVVEEILGHRSTKGVDLLLILDQFEEFFLYHRARAEELAELFEQLTERGTRVNVLVSLREDALALLDEFETDIPAVFESTLRLEHLDAAAAEAAIRKPLDHYNAARPGELQVGIEDSLVDELLSQVRTGRVQVDSLQEKTGPGTLDDHHEALRIEAPYLQLVLTRLWDEETSRGSALLRLATLRELGGAQEIVRQHLNRVMREFTPPEMAVLADAFGHLVTPSGSKIAHRPSDLAEFSGRDPAQMASLMHRLAEGDQRILRDVPPPLDDPHAEPRYEIFHDVLALAVLDWRRRFLAEAHSRHEQAELRAENERVEQETRQTRNRLRKARALIAGMALLLVACIALAGLALYSRGQAEDRKADALAERDRADLNGVLDDVNGLLRSDPSAALLKAQDLDLDADSDPDGRFQDAYRRAFDASDTDVEIHLDSPVLLASFTASDDLVTVTEDGHVRVWDVVSRRPMRVSPEPSVDVTVPGTEPVRVAEAYSAVQDGYAVVRTDASEVSAVDLESGEVSRLDLTLGDDASISVPRSGDRNRILAWDREGHGAVWDVQADRVIPAPVFAGSSVASADIDPTGEYLAVAIGGPLEVQVLDVESGNVVDRTDLTSRAGQVVQYGRVGFTSSPGPVLMIVTVGSKSEAALWEVSTGAAPVPLGKGKTWRQIYDVTDVYDVAAADDEQYNGLVAVAGDKNVQLFDAQGKGKGKVRTNTVDARDWITRVVPNPADTRVFAVASAEGYVELYRQLNLNPPHPLWVYRGHRGLISDVAFSEDGKHLVTASRDGTVRIWRSPARTSLWYIPDWILAATYTPDGSYLFGFTPYGYVVRQGEGDDLKDKFVSLYGQATDMDPAPDNIRAVVAEEYCGVPVVVAVAKGAKETTLAAPADGSAVCPTTVAWNPQVASHQIVAGTYDNKLISWDSETGAVTGTASLGATSSEVHDVAFSGDGETVVVTTGTAGIGLVHVLRATDLKELQSWQASDQAFLDVSTDGRYVATAGNDRHLVQVWDTENVDEPLQQLDQATGTLSHVTLSQDPDASRVAVTTSEGVVYVWDRVSGRLLAAMRRHADAANQVDFDPRDIDRMASASDDGEMVTYVCDLCSMSATELVEAGKDRVVQEVTLPD